MKCIVLIMLSSFASAVDFSTVPCAGQNVTVCRVDPANETLQLFHRDANGIPYKRFEVLERALATQGRELTFAMNAGMYHGDFSAVGLFVAEGQQLSPLNLADAPGNFFLKPNGVFLLTAKGARVVESSEYLAIQEKVLLATQSGPLLVHEGRLHPSFRAESKSRLRRNGVGVTKSGEVIFAISEGPVNFHAFATFFRDVLHCPNALFLDGTVSSLHAPALKRSDFRMDLGPMLGVTKSVKQ
jgi:uncharacterized protein YigE (DUF2233 family)